MKNTNRFELNKEKAFPVFLDVSNQFKNDLNKVYTVTWLRDRGKMKVDNPNNWFISWVPVEWGYPLQTLYGVHYELKYKFDRETGKEYLRMPVGVENPLMQEHRFDFKTEVVEKMTAMRLILPGTKIWSKEGKQAKLIEPEWVELNEKSCEKLLERYSLLTDFNTVVSEVISGFKEGFGGQWSFPNY